MDLPILKLRRHEDRRIRLGHLWIFSNEIDTQKTPLGAIPPGSLCRIEDASGKPLGLAQVNPHSLICGRILSRKVERLINGAFWRSRLRRAMEMRESFLAGPYYRLVHGEGDGLPGLIVDRYGDQLVLQPNTLAMEHALPEIVAALQELLAPAGILLKAGGPARALEGLGDRVEVLHGQVPELLDLEENGCRFAVDARHGQKTGWFYDHRANRARLMSWARGRRCLDLFSYAGGFAIPLARAGAAEVLAIDGSQRALELLTDNARRNGVADRVHTLHGDVFAVLRELRDRDAHFDLIALDPPAFIKSRKDIREGTMAYRRLNDLALRLLSPGGILFSASCSHHLSRDSLLTQIAHASAERSPVMVIGEGGQDLDHPVHPAIPETAYLKGFFLRRVPDE